MDYWYLPHCVGHIGCYEQKVDSIMLGLIDYKRKEDYSYVASKWFNDGYNLPYFRRHRNDFPQDT